MDEKTKPKLTVIKGGKGPKEPLPANVIPFMPPQMKVRPPLFRLPGGKKGA